MAAMTEDELRAITDSEMRQSIGYLSGALAEQRRKAMYYYLCEAKEDLAPPEIDGRSSVISPDVRNTVESMLPQLQVKFTGADSPVEFLPRKPGDEEKAKQATDYVSWVYNTQNGGELITYAWMKDALLSKAGFLKVWWDDRFEEKREDYEELDDIELAQLMDDEEIEVIEQTSKPDEEDAEQRVEAIKQLSAQLAQAQQAAQQNPQAAQAVAQIQQQIEAIKAKPPKLLYTVGCKRTPKARVCVENVPPEEMLIHRRAKTIKTAKFIGHRFTRTMSDLKTSGYKNLDRIGAEDSAAASLNMERIERLSWDDEMAYLQETGATMDESQRTYWVAECYIRVDFDGDGITELRKVVRCGNAILENVIVDEAPFVCITPVPQPHKLIGLSVADLALESQRVNTALLRGVLDNTYLEVNGRHYAVEGKVNLDDLLTSRPGGVVRVKEAGAAGRLDQGAGDSQIGMGMLAYMRGFLEDATGWRRDSAGNSADSIKDPMSATQANIIAAQADMRVDLIARVFAEGFRELFRMILKLSAQYSQREEVISLRGKWVSMNPREWRRGFDTIVNVGLGIGSKDQQVAHMMALIQQQQMGLQDGTATPPNLYESRKDLVELLGKKAPERFFTDPRQTGPKPPQPSPDVMVKVQADMQAKQMDLQHDAQKFQADMQLKMQAQQQAHEARLSEIQKQYELQASNDARDSQREALKAQFEQQRAAADAENARVIQAMKGELEKYKADLAAQTQLALGQLSAPPAIDIGPIQAALDGLIEQMGAPAIIVRDQSGRAVGVKRGNVTKQIQRDANGRAVGVQ